MNSKQKALLIQKELLKKLGDDTKITITTYNERNQTLRIAVSVNGESRPDITINPEKKLHSRYAFLNVKDYPWIQDFFYNNKLTLEIESYYRKKNISYPLCQISLLDLKELDPGGYEVYHILTTSEQKPQNNRWNNQDMSKQKAAYKTSDAQRAAFNRYHQKTYSIEAIFPLGTKARIEALGEKPTTFFRKAVANYLKYLEKR